MRRFDTACSLTKMKEKDLKLVKPFCTFGLDLFHAGTTKSHFGAVVGIPVNYFYSSEAEIERPSIKLKTESIKWGSQEGELLANSIVLTEDEQIYGIAHSILMTHSHQRMLNGLYASGTIIGTYTLGHFLNQRMQLLARPFLLRGILYAILGLFGFGLWALLKDATHVYYEGLADDTLGDLGPEVADSGVRFYEKIMGKNKALRGITKTNTYSTEGDICYLIRTKTFPYTARKALLQDKLKEYRDKEEKENES